jgi:hypothetical protein
MILRVVPDGETGGVTRGRKLIEGVSQHLEAGETIHCLVDGACEVDVEERDSVRHGVAVATDRRLLFFALNAYGEHELASFAYPSISSFEQSRGMMGGSMSFTVSGNRTTVKWIPPGTAFRQFCEWMQSRVGPTPVGGATLPA